MKPASNSLKRSWLITAISIGLMLAPIGNFVFSAWALGIFGEASPVTWGELFSKTHLLDVIVSLGLVTSGALLWRQHRSSWLLAVGILSAVTILNVRAAWIISHGDFSGQIQFQMAANIVATMACFAIVLYMRYPYVDRRHGWVANDPRYETSLACSVQIDGNPFPATLVSISRSGARIEHDPAYAKTYAVLTTGSLSAEGRQTREFEIVAQQPGILRLRWKRRIRNVEGWITSDHADSAKSSDQKNQHAS